MTVTDSAATDTPDAAASGHSGQERLIPLTVKLALGAVVLAVFGLICYGIGTNHGKAKHVLTGRAYVSERQVGVMVDGRAYGVDLSQSGLNWYDANGDSHEGGLPQCLQHPGYTWIRFGYANADGLAGDSWRVVTWVQCIKLP